MEKDYSRWLVRYRVTLDAAIAVWNYIGASNMNCFAFSVLCIVCGKEEEGSFLVLHILDGRRYDLILHSASSRCYLYDNLGKLIPKFERKEEKAKQFHWEAMNFRAKREYEIEQLSTSVDFLMDLCDTVEDSASANLSHQVVDFILALKQPNLWGETDLLGSEHYPPEQLLSKLRSTEP
ncbi:hypothetical protein NE237_025476 [Protea cynaroides]|uniref:Uncharacterized protein n=1 Tax=Protea cynaroides TaxID=273540 RepID=A0A9Q0H347_9MAGN|nr:hypothetical protein NE237_025476 [Protea cynaroides]